MMKKVFLISALFLFLKNGCISAQLLTNRQIVLKEMQLRSDDLWPRGEGHIVLAIPGSLEDEKSYLEPGGSFSPAFGSFGISIWISDKHEIRTWSCDNISLQAIEQSFAGGRVPSVVTKTYEYDLTHTVHSTNDYSIQIIPHPETGHKLSLVIRSVGPAGGPVKKLTWDGKNLVVNDTWNISITPQPEYVAMGDETHEGWKNLKTSSSLYLSEDGWGFARIGLSAHEYSVRITRNVKCFHSPLTYHTLFSSLRINLPDKRFAQSLNAQVVNLMMGLVRDECRPGDPNNYPLPWLRDGAYQIAALARAGQIEVAKKLALYFAKNDFFGGFGPEGDAPGLAIWGIIQVAMEAKDTAFNNAIWPHIKRKAEFIEKMLTTKEAIRVPITHPVIHQTRKSPDSNLVCEPARDGLITGRMDWHRPILFVNSVNYSGLKYAALIAGMLGHKEESVIWKQKSEQLQQAWIKAFDKECDNERTFICSLWPDWIAAPVKDKYLAKAREQWNNHHDTATGEFRETPLWTYFTFADAHQWLYLQKPEYTWSTLEWFWNHQNSPGLYTWWEGNGEENTSGRWNNVRGWVTPKHVTPHYWTAAMALLLQLDMLAYLDESGKETAVIIGEGIKKEWLDQPMSVENIRLKGNIINWQWDKKVLRVQINGDKIKVKAGSPFGEKTKVKVEWI